MCTSTALHCPFEAERDEILEQWLAGSIGEFLLVAMPELVPEIVNHLGDLKPLIGGDLYRNILVLPAGYRSWGRKEENGQVNWSISAWEIQRKFHSLTDRSQPPRNNP